MGISKKQYTRDIEIECKITDINKVILDRQRFSIHNTRAFTNLFRFLNSLGAKIKEAYNFFIQDEEEEQSWFK